MVKEIVKEASRLAEEELKNEEIQRLKLIVKTTLELLQKKEEARKNLDEEIKILNRDLLDLKEGRIDRIKERQDIDAKAKEVSIIIIKEKIIERQVSSPWYIPWVIEMKSQYIPISPTVQVFGSVDFDFQTTNSTAHMYTSGTYQLNNGAIKYL